MKPWVRGVLGGLAVTQELGPDKKGSASSDAPQVEVDEKIWDEEDRMEKVGECLVTFDIILPCSECNAVNCLPTCTD